MAEQLLSLDVIKARIEDWFWFRTERSPEAEAALRELLAVVEPEPGEAAGSG